MRRRLGLDQRDEHVFQTGVVLAVLLAQLCKRALGNQFPDAMTPMRSAMRSATSRMCVVMITVQPDADAVLQQSLDVTRGERVEPGERLVQDDQSRVMHQRAGQRHLLPHALGKSLAALVQMRFQPERDQEFARGAFGNPGIDAPQAGNEFDIFQRRQLVVDHRLVGDPGHDLLGGDGIAQGIDAEDRDRAGVGLQQPGHHAQRRGLAGAVRAEQCVEFAGANREIERIDRRAVKTLR